HQLLHQYFIRVVRIGLGELVPAFRPGVLEVAEEVFRIQRRAAVVAAGWAGKPTLCSHGGDDVLLELIFLTVGHVQSLLPMPYRLSSITASAATSSFRPEAGCSAAWLFSHVP